jgi:precorrin-6B methylase 2
MWIIPVVLIVLLILIISMIWTHPHGGPWIPSSRAMVRNMLDLAQVQPGDLVYDLGCGDGRVIITAARHYGAQAVGIELDPLRWLWCRIWVRMLGLRDRVDVKRGDLFQQDLSEADVVICYLLPEATDKLQDKLLAELKPGTRVVSNTFLFPRMRESGSSGKARLYHFSEENTLAAYIKRELEKTARE